MSDKVEDIVGRAIEYTRPLLEYAPERWRRRAAACEEFTTISLATPRTIPHCGA